MHHTKVVSSRLFWFLGVYGISVSLSPAFSARMLCIAFLGFFISAQYHFSFVVLFPTLCRYFGTYSAAFQRSGLVLLPYVVLWGFLF